VSSLQLKIDLHVHTQYSYDGLITPKELVFYAKRRGLDGVAITDHDRIDGALRIAEETDFLIIPGIEISTLNGHVIGLNLQEQISRGMTVDETVDKIHEANGIALACHPSTYFKGSLRESHITSNFDAIEVINASALPFKYSVKHNKRLASCLSISQVAGSDAHYAPEIGYAYTVVDAQSEVDEIIKAIKKGSCQPFGNAIPLKTRLKREILVLKRKMLK